MTQYFYDIYGSDPDTWHSDPSDQFAPDTERAIGLCVCTIKRLARAINKCLYVDKEHPTERRKIYEAIITLCASITHMEKTLSDYITSQHDPMGIPYALSCLQGHQCSMLMQLSIMRARSNELVRAIKNVSHRYNRQDIMNTAHGLIDLVAKM